ncbi:hypothetical protein Patl1_15098 [Pistacia atlantica]|uniref:Uncharacterized protein n=1 Tax=Pistacia atlantica TaxID=434234 RepID=A0ACC1B9V6_9ROSI|nr:hypothetical protein Patl1_15098 [Pistacia atlantica]
MRQLKEMMMMTKEEGDGDGSTVAFLLWAFLVTLSIISAVVFSCAGGASKDKDSATNADAAYGSNCAAGCGAGCGG